MKKQIFEIEEDPHFYKKYVLYYSEAEVEAIKGLDFGKLNELISDKSQFNIYSISLKQPLNISAAAKSSSNCPS